MRDRKNQKIDSGFCELLMLLTNFYVLGCETKKQKRWTSMGWMEMVVRYTLELAASTEEM